MERRALLENFLYHPPKPTYHLNSFPGQLCILNGVLCIALEYSKPSTNIAIYCHANATDVGKCKKYLLGLQSTLGVHIILIEYPGYGCSNGTPTEESLCQSARLVYQFLHNTLKWPEKSIMIIGRSIGSGPAIEVATKENVGALILISPFTNMKAVAQLKIGMLATLFQDKWQNIKKMSGISCPTLFLHGLADEVIPPDHSVQLFELCSSEEKRLIYLDFGHNYFDWNPVIEHIHNFMSSTKTLRFFSKSKSKSQKTLDIPPECYEGLKNQKIRAIKEAEDDLVNAIGGNPDFEVSDKDENNCSEYLSQQEKSSTDLPQVDNVQYLQMLDLDIMPFYPDMS